MAELPFTGQFIPRYDLAPHWFELKFDIATGDLFFAPGVKIALAGNIFECIEEWRPGKPTLFKLVEAGSEAAKKRLELAREAGL